MYVSKKLRSFYSDVTSFRDGSTKLASKVLEHLSISLSLSLCIILLKKSNLEISISRLLITVIEPKKPIQASDTWLICINFVFKIRSAVCAVKYRRTRIKGNHFIIISLHHFTGAAQYTKLAFLDYIDHLLDNASRKCMLSGLKTRTTNYYKNLVPHVEQSALIQKVDFL